MFITFSLHYVAYHGDSLVFDQMKASSSFSPPPPPPPLAISLFIYFFFWVLLVLCHTRWSRRMLEVLVYTILHVRRQFSI